MVEQLPLSFFSRDTVKVAKELIGKIISIGSGQDRCDARIVETEAYKDDPASHAYKKTERSALMYDTSGHVYVYLIYGMYECVNFTTEKIGKPGAVLIRAVEPLSGIKLMKKRRGTGELTNLCSGPGKLCQALGIGRELNGGQLGERIKIYDDDFQAGKIGKSSRIGIKDALNLQWRFFLEGNEFVSRAKP
jgi:DNA-3-methyladenine glycosylase